MSLSEVQVNDLARPLVGMKVGIYPVGTGVQISREALNTDGTLNYTKLITYLTENAARNQLIADSIEQRPSLILSDRLNHLETLISLLPVDMQKDAVMISGKMTTKKGKAEREQALEDMRSGKKKYLFATYSLAKVSRQDRVRSHTEPAERQRLFR